MNEGEKYVGKARLEHDYKMGYLRLAVGYCWDRLGPITAETLFGTCRPTPEGYHLRVTTELVKDAEPTWPLLHLPDTTYITRCGKCLAGYSVSEIPTTPDSKCRVCGACLSGILKWDPDHLKQDPKE